MASPSAGAPALKYGDVNTETSSLGEVKGLMNAEQSKNIIYTFTSILKNNFKFEIINNKYGKINSKEINHIITKNIKSERSLENKSPDFYCNDLKICMIHFEIDDLENLEFISNYIERI